MKKYLLFLALGCFVFGATAQNQPNHMLKDSKPLQATVKKHVPAIGNEIPMLKDDKTISNKPSAASFQKDMQEVVIGHSFYATQTNSCIQQRCIRDGSDIHAAWTMSQEPGHSDRGTGYVAYSPTLWGDEPLERLESERTGWPTLLKTGGGRTLSIAHTSGPPYGLLMTYKDAGETSWSEIDIPTDIEMGVLWGHATIGGADNNTIHCLALSVPVGLDGALVDGQDGTVRYYRSTDQGDTWDVYDYLIPGTGVENFLGFGADSYDIHSRGDRVIIGLFGEWHDSVVLISEDGGDTWNQTILRDFPVDLYEADSQLIDVDEWPGVDTILTVDGCGKVYLDQAGQAHATYSDMFVIDDDTLDGTTSWFPGTDGVNYWNETYGADSSQYVGWLLDQDGSGVFDFVDLSADAIGAYPVSVTSHSTIAEDDQGHIYVVWSGVHEEYSNGTQHFRHVWATKSEDGGMTFGDQHDLTPDPDYFYYEYAYPCAAQVVDDQIHIIVQRDDEPGTELTDADPVAEQDIVYIGVTSDLDSETVVSVPENEAVISVYPIPARDIAYLNLGELGAANVDVYNSMGALVLSQYETNKIVTLDLSELATGVYMLTATKDGVRHTTQMIIE